MEGIASSEIGRGFCSGIHNSRGVHWRSEGGEQERELATKYRALADRLHFDYALQYRSTRQRTGHRTMRVNPGARTITNLSCETRRPVRHCYFGTSN